MDIGINILEYVSMDDAVRFAVCDRSFNHIYQQRIDQLFGTMNNLILSNHAFCSFLSKWKLEQTLNAIPAFKNIYVNVSTLINTHNLIDILKLFYRNDYGFIRGFDISSNLPFLICILSTDVPCTQQNIQERLVIVIFNHIGIESIIFSEDLTARWTRGVIWHSYNFDGIIDNIMTIDDVIKLLNNGKIYDVLNVTNSVWIHRCDVDKRHQQCENLRLALAITVTPLLSIGSGIIGFMWIYRSPMNSGYHAIPSLISMAIGCVFSYVCPDLRPAIAVFCVGVGLAILCSISPLFGAICFAVYCGGLCYFICMLFITLCMALSLVHYFIGN